MGINWGCVMASCRGLMGAVICMRASDGKLGLCDGQGG